MLHILICNLILVANVVILVANVYMTIRLISDYKNQPTSNGNSRTNPNREIKYGELCRDFNESRSTNTTNKSEHVSEVPEIDPTLILKNRPEIHGFGSKSKIEQ